MTDGAEQRGGEVAWIPRPGAVYRRRRERSRKPPEASSQSLVADKSPIERVSGASKPSDSKTKNSRQIRSGSSFLSGFVRPAVIREGGGGPERVCGSVSGQAKGDGVHSRVLVWAGSRPAWQRATRWCGALCTASYQRGH